MLRLHPLFTVTLESKREGTDSHVYYYDYSILTSFSHSAGRGRVFQSSEYFKAAFSWQLSPVFKPVGLCLVHHLRNLRQHARNRTNNSLFRPGSSRQTPNWLTSVWLTNSENFVWVKQRKMLMRICSSLAIELMDGFIKIVIESGRDCKWTFNLLSFNYIATGRRSEKMLNDFKSVC